MPSTHLGPCRRFAIGSMLAAFTLFSAVNAPADPPLILENFSNFTSVTGTAGTTRTNDLGGTFELLNSTTAGGFNSVTSFGQQSPNLALSYNPRTESAFLLGSSVDFATFSQQSHQVALRFRYSGTGAAASARGPLFIMYQAGTGSPTYMLRVGRNASSVLTMSPSFSTATGPAYSTFAGIPVTEGAWHTLVIQYDNATNATSNTAAVRIWIDPLTDTDPAPFAIASGTIGTWSGPSTTANYAIWGGVFGAPNANAPTEVTIDTIGIWDGNSVSATNGLGAALDHFGATVPVEISAFHLD